MTRINYKKLSINELIKYTVQSDLSATAELIRRIQKDIFTFFCHLGPPNDNVADLTQETLIKIIKNINKLHNPAFFKNWYNKIAINVFYDNLRKYKKQNKIIDKENEENITLIEDKKKQPADKCQSKELECQIKACIINLPINARIAIVLRELEGLSYEEIAKLTNTNLGTVKSRISRAREKLQLQLANYL